MIHFQIDDSTENNNADYARGMAESGGFAMDADAPGVSTVRFNAAKRQYLSVAKRPSLDLSQITALVVAKASGNSANMWLFGKNSFSRQWTGYGIAVHGGDNIVGTDPGFVRRVSFVNIGNQNPALIV